MKKLKIKNKRKFKKAILTLIMAITIIVGTVMFCNYLKIRGFESLFTTNVYKEAFKETNKIDIAIINMFMGIFIGSTVMCAFNLLLENESEEQEDYALNQILKRNEVNM